MADEKPIVIDKPTAESLQADLKALSAILADGKIDATEAVTLGRWTYRNWRQIGTIVVLLIGSIGGTVAVMKGGTAPAPLVVEPHDDIVTAIKELDAHMAAALSGMEKTADKRQLDLKLFIIDNRPTPPDVDPPSPNEYITFEGPSTIDIGGQPIDFRVRLGKNAKDLKVWVSPDTTTYFRFLGDRVIVGPPPFWREGDIIYIEATAQVDGKILDPVFWRIKGVRAPIPPPEPPKPPVPPPEPPKPPVPPTPTVEPILGKGGMRVMIIHEASKTLGIKQHSVLYGKQVRDYLNAKTTPTTDGTKRGYIITDKDNDFTADAAKVWAAALARPRQSVPWVIVSSSKGNFEGPLPADIPATLELLKKYEE